MTCSDQYAAAALRMELRESFNVWMSGAGVVLVNNTSAQYVLAVILYTSTDESANAELGPRSPSIAKLYNGFLERNYRF